MNHVHCYCVVETTHLVKVRVCCGCGHRVPVSGPFTPVMPAPRTPGPRWGPFPERRGGRFICRSYPPILLR